jgi:nitroreductase
MAMENLREVIESRRSIRKYLPDEVPEDFIKDVITAATHAPSGCNSQCWKFIVVRDKNLLEQIALAAEVGIRDFYRDTPDFESVIDRRIRQITFFRHAPAVIFVFMTKMAYYDPRVVEYYHQKGFSDRQMLDALGYPDVLSVGAAVQNMLLTIHAGGYGACWMNDPIIAAREICQVLGLSDESQLLSVIPFGKPAYAPRSKVFKPMEDILEIR